MPSIRAVVLLPYRMVRYRPLRGRWFGPYLWKALTRRPLPSNRPIDVIVIVVDHFEPASRFGDAAAIESVNNWCTAYQNQISGLCDSNGRGPQHTWFYRAEYANLGCLRELSKLCFEGLGEIEFHLHHGYDTHETFREKLERGLDFFNQYGAMLTLEETPRRRFSYIAGAWSLDNGTFDDSKSGCTTELAALRDAGCYCDFTFPALGSKAQPRTTNSIYYSTDDPLPKSYDTGKTVRVGGTPSGDLMMFQGPSGFDWQSFSFEGAAVESYSPPSISRLKAWIAPQIHIAGRPEWIFIKLHCHGMQSKDLYGSPRIREMFQWMIDAWNQGQFRLHFVNAREAYNIVKAAEHGETGNPAAYLDFEIPRPANRAIYCSTPWRLQEYSTSYSRITVDPCEGARLRMVNTGISSVEGALRQVEIRKAGSRLQQIKIHSDSKAVAWQHDARYEIPVGCWHDLECVV